MAAQAADASRQCPDTNRQNGNLLYHLFQPGDVFGAIVICQQRLDAHTDTHLNHANQHSGLACRRHGRYGICSVTSQQTVGKGGGKSRQDTAQRVRHSQCQNGEQLGKIPPGKVDVHIQYSRFLYHKIDIIQRPCKISNYRCSRRSGHSHSHHQNK